MTALDAPDPSRPYPVARSLDGPGQTFSVDPLPHAIPGRISSVDTGTNHS